MSNAEWAIQSLKSEIEKLKAENERLKKRLSGFQHNHITRDIKDKGECPACDRHHEKSEITKLTQKNETMKKAVEQLKTFGYQSQFSIIDEALQEAEQECEGAK